MVIYQMLRFSWIPTLFFSTLFLRGVDTPRDNASLVVRVFLIRKVRFHRVSSFTLVKPLSLYLYSINNVPRWVFYLGQEESSNPYFYFFVLS